LQRNFLAHQRIHISGRVPRRKALTSGRCLRLSQICIRHANLLSIFFDGLAARKRSNSLTGLLGLLYRHKVSKKKLRVAPAAAGGSAFPPLSELGKSSHHVEGVPRGAGIEQGLKIASGHGSRQTPIRNCSLNLQGYLPCLAGERAILRSAIFLAGENRTSLRGTRPERGYFVWEDFPASEKFLAIMRRVVYTMPEFYTRRITCGTA